jgi:hypothetical protein
VKCSFFSQVSYPKILSMVAKQLWKMCDGAEFDVLCGVPYTALPFATAMSTDNNVPMVLRRKEAKDYGTKKMVEGVYKQVHFLEPLSWWNSSLNLFPRQWCHRALPALLRCKRRDLMRNAPLFRARNA